MSVNPISPYMIPSGIINIYDYFFSLPKTPNHSKRLRLCDLRFVVIEDNFLDFSIIKSVNIAWECKYIAHCANFTDSTDHILLKSNN